MWTAVLRRQKGGVGGTGIVGVVTGFGSICVNGVEVDYDTATVITLDGVGVDSSALAIGQLVQVEAQGGGKSFKASRIATEHIVVGPQSRVDRQGVQLEVPGQIVKVDRRGLDAALRAQREGGSVKVRRDLGRNANPLGDFGYRP